MVKVIGPNSRIAFAHGRFNRILHVAPMCTTSNSCFLGPTRVRTPNGIPIGSAVFAYAICSSRKKVPIFYNGPPLPHPKKITPVHGGIWTPSNVWFLWHTGVHNQNGISIDSAVFARLTMVTDRQTLQNHAIQSVTIGRIYVRSTMMRPKNTHRTFKTQKN